MPTDAFYKAAAESLRKAQAAGTLAPGYDVSKLDNATKYYYDNPNTTTSSGYASTVGATTPSGTSSLYTTNNADSLASIKAALDSQNTAQASLYNQQASDQAAKIKAALAAQQITADSNISNLENQYGTAINSLNTEKAKLPAQTQVMNNSASSLGQQTAQKIRTAMAQMGLLQSGESASQALKNETTTANSINTNNVNQQNLDADYGNKIAAAQQELASKLAAIRDAMAVAQENGDAQSLAIAQEAAAQINAEGAKNALAYQNWANTIGQQNFTNSLAQQQFDANQLQNAIENAYRENQSKIAQQQFGQSLGLQEAGLTGIYNGQKTLAAQAADQAANQFELQYGLSVGEALGNINGNPTLAAKAQAIQEAQFNANLALQKEELAANNAYRSASLARSGSGSGGSGGGSNGGTTAANNEAFSVLNNLANQGKTRTEIINYLNQHFDDFEGIDYDKLLARVQKAFTWDRDGAGNWYNTAAKPNPDE